MARPTAWLILVILLLGVLIAREPELREVDEMLLGSFLRQSPMTLPPAPVTLVEITRLDLEKQPAPASPPPAETTRASKDQAPLRHSAPPLDYALFLQAVLEFEPAVVGFEPMLTWRGRDKEQQQIFIDQAMRVPKLLVAVELGGKGEHDLSPDEMPSFPNVSGQRGGLAQFIGVRRKPDDDIRLIATAGFTNLPEGEDDWRHLPMLFDYRGEVVPSFPLQAIMLWLRATPAEVKIELGSQIILPNGWKIPIRRDGTLMINPRAESAVRHLSLDQILLAAHERETHRPPSLDLAGLKNQIVLVRAADDPLQPPNLFATAIATIQDNAYLRRASWLYECAIILAAVLLGFFLWQISKWNLLMSTIGFSAGYCLLVLGVLAHARLWFPTFLPLSLLWFLCFVRLFGTAPQGKKSSA